MFSKEQIESIKNRKHGNIPKKDNAQTPTSSKPVVTEPEWKEIKEFPGYEMNRQGEIRHIQITYLNISGKKTVVFSRNNKTYSRSIAKLLTKLFP